MFGEGRYISTSCIGKKLEIIEHAKFLLVIEHDKCSFICVHCILLFTDEYGESYTSCNPRAPTHCCCDQQGKCFYVVLFYFCEFWASCSCNLGMTDLFLFNCLLLILCLIYITLALRLTGWLPNSNCPRGMLILN